MRMKYDSAILMVEIFIYCYEECLSTMQSKVLTVPVQYEKLLSPLLKTTLGGGGGGGREAGKGANSGQG